MSRRTRFFVLAFALLLLLPAQSLAAKNDKKSAKAKISELIVGPGETRTASVDVVEADGTITQVELTVINTIDNSTINTTSLAFLQFEPQYSAAAATTGTCYAMVGRKSGFGWYYYKWETSQNYDTNQFIKTAWATSYWFRASVSTYQTFDHRMYDKQAVVSGNDQYAFVESAGFFTGWYREIADIQFNIRANFTCGISTFINNW